MCLLYVTITATESGFDKLKRLVELLGFINESLLPNIAFIFTRFLRHCVVSEDLSPNKCVFVFKKNVKLKLRNKVWREG